MAPVFKKYISLASVLTCMVWHTNQAIIVFTYKQPETVTINKVDLSMAADKVDNFLVTDLDYFSTSGPFGTKIRVEKPKPGEEEKEPKKTVEPPCTDWYCTPYAKESFTKLEKPEPVKKDISIDNEFEYGKLFNQTVSASTNQKFFEKDSFNLLSRASFELTYRPSDFYATTDLFKTDPQLNSIIDYFVNGQKMEPGETLYAYQQTAYLEVVRKDEISFGGSFSQMPSVYQITCPAGRRVEFDVSEIEGLPTYHITTRTKGCNITLTGYVGAEFAG